MLHNLRVHAKAQGNRKRIGASRHADQKAVRRPQRRHVEFATGVLHTLCLQRIGLQLRIMRRRCNARPLAAQCLQNGHGERGALDRVRPRAELIQQDQAGCIGLFKDFDNIRHMGGKRREGLLDALFIADIRQHMVENRNLAVVRHGQQQAAHRHQRQQTNRFQRNGLAAGIRTGDHQGIKMQAEFNVGRHHLFLVDQRMARPFEFDLPLVVDQRQGRLHLIAQIGLGKDQVQLHRLFVSGNDPAGKIARLCGELRQDALHFRLLLGEQHANLVVCLHNGHGLDEHRCAGGGGIVNQAGHIAAALRLDRHDEPPVAHGDDRVL